MYVHIFIYIIASFAVAIDTDKRLLLSDPSYLNNELQKLKTTVQQLVDERANVSSLQASLVASQMNIASLQTSLAAEKAQSRFTTGIACFTTKFVSFDQRYVFVVQLSF